MSESTKVPRKRSQNFSVTENRQLINLVMEYHDIIDNKKNSAETWVEKRNAWLEIEEKFNATTGENHRTAEGLKLKYECMKKDLRKKAGLSSSGDETKSVLNESYSASLREELNKLAMVLEESLPPSSQNVASINNISISSEGSNTATRTWRPHSLKMQKTNMLRAKRRSMISTHNQLSKLAKAKSELVQLQVDLQKADAAFKSKEYNMKIQLLQEELNLTIQQKLNKQTMYEKKIELLNKQLFEQNLKNQLLQIELKKFK